LDLKCRRAVKFTSSVPSWNTARQVNDEPSVPSHGIGLLFIQNLINQRRSLYKGSGGRSIYGTMSSVASKVSIISPAYTFQSTLWLSRHIVPGRSLTCIYDRTFTSSWVGFYSDVVADDRRMSVLISPKAMMRTRTPTG